MRALGTPNDGSALGVFTDKQDTLSNDFFVNLLDMNTKRHPTTEEALTFEGRDRTTGAPKWTASRIDLVFGSNSQLRALGEVYAADDAQEKFVRDFVRAWDKVMMLDRFEVSQNRTVRAPLQERPHRSGFAGPSELTRVHIASIRSRKFSSTTFRLTFRPRAVSSLPFSSDKSRGRIVNFLIVSPPVEL